MLRGKAELLYCLGGIAADKSMPYAMHTWLVYRQIRCAGRGRWTEFDVPLIWVLKSVRVTLPLSDQNWCLQRYSRWTQLLLLITVNNTSLQY